MNEDANVDTPSNTCDPRLIESLDRLAACIEGLRQWTAESHSREGTTPSASRHISIETSESAHEDSAVPMISTGPEPTAKTTEAIEDTFNLDGPLWKLSPSNRGCSQPSRPMPDDDPDDREVVRTDWPADYQHVPDELLESFWRVAFIDERNEVLKKWFAKFPWLDCYHMPEAIGEGIVIGSSDLKRDWFSCKMRDLSTVFPAPRIKYGPPYHTGLLDLTCNDQMLQRRLEDECSPWWGLRRGAVWRKIIQEKIEEAWPPRGMISAGLVEEIDGEVRSWSDLETPEPYRHLHLEVNIESGRKLHDPKSKPGLLLSIIRLCNVTNAYLEVLPIESVTFFANLFLIPPQNERFEAFGREGIHCVSPFLSAVQRGGSGCRIGLSLNITNFILWHMKAGQVTNETGERAGDQEFQDTTGLPLYRDIGWIGNSDKSNGFHFREWFCTICVHTRREAGTATGVVVSWIDKEGPAMPRLYHGWWNEYIDACGRDGETYIFFIRQILWAFNVWRKLWGETMDEIDGLIYLKLSDTMNQERWKTLMFDSAFQISELYFSILQMLRIFTNWIKEVEDNLPQLYDGVKRAAANLRRDCTENELKICEFDLDHDVLSENLDKLDTKIKKYIRELESRIERKKVEVESLRDGLFNAASLREAVTARTLNLFVIVFTVVTVIYTPLGFLATLWSMSNLSSELNGNESATTPESFISSWIILPLGTYLSSVIFLFIAWVKTSPGGGFFWSRTLKRGRERWTRTQEKLKDLRDRMAQVTPLRRGSPPEDEERVDPRIHRARRSPTGRRSELRT